MMKHELKMNPFFHWDLIFLFFAAVGLILAVSGGDGNCGSSILLYGDSVLALSPPARGRVNRTRDSLSTIKSF